MIEKFTRLISDSPEGKSFFTDYGEIKSLLQLKSFLAEKGQSFYSAYTGSGTNHFSNWVEGVFEDNVLANELRNSDSHEKAIKAIDDRLRYAELWLGYNTDKERLNNYLANGELSLKRIMNSPEFTPEHHRFETIYDLDLHAITKVSPPKTTFIQNFATVFQKKEAGIIPETEIMKNAVPLKNTTVVKRKEAVMAEDDERTAELMQSLFPGSQVISLSSLKNFFSGIFSKILK